MNATHTTTINLHNAIWNASGATLKGFVNSMDEDQIRWMLTSHLQSFMMHKSVIKTQCDINEIHLSKLQNVPVQSLLNPTKYILQ